MADWRIGLGSSPPPRSVSQPPDWPYHEPAAFGAIGYVQKAIPALTLKPVEGKTYQDTVPDTLEVADMAQRAINVLTCATDANQDYEQYFSVYLGSPLRIAHYFSDWCGTKYMEATALAPHGGHGPVCRASRSRWMEVTLRSTGADGLFYFPLAGKPWYGRELWWSKGIARADGTIFTGKPPDAKFRESLDTYARGTAHAQPWPIRALHSSPILNRAEECSMF